MADTLDEKYGRTSAVWAKIWRKLGRGGHAPRGRRVWVAQDADPAVDAASQGTYPVQIDDFAYRVDDDEAFICTVAPTANTAATFVQLHA